MPFKTVCDYKAFALILGAGACFSAFYGLSTLDEMIRLLNQVEPSSSYALHLCVLFQGIVFNGIFLTFCGPQSSLLVAELSFAVLVFGNIFSASQFPFIRSIYVGCGATLLWAAAPCCLNYIFVQHWKRDPSRTQLYTTIQHRKLWIGYLYAALMASRVVGKLMRFVLTSQKSESFKGSNTSYYNMIDCIQHRVQQGRVENLALPALHILTVSCAVLLICGLYANKLHTVSSTPTKKTKKSGKNRNKRLKVAADSSLGKVCSTYHIFLILPMMSYGLKEYFYALHQNNHTLCLHETEKVILAVSIDLWGAIAAVACIKVARKFGHFPVVVVCFILDNFSFGVHIMESMLNPRNINLSILFLLAAASGIGKGSMWTTLSAMLMELYPEDVVSSQIGMSMWYHGGIAVGMVIYFVMDVSTIFQMFIPISISSALIMAALEQKLRRKRARREEGNNPELAS